MEGKIQIVKKPEKPEVNPIGARDLQELKAYYVVSVQDKFTDVCVGDIVIRFPSKTNGIFIFNCTSQMMLLNWDSYFQCVHAFDIAHVIFYNDTEDKPHE